MAGVKISALPAIVTPAATDLFATVQSGVTYKVTGTQMGTLFLPISGGTMTGNLILNGNPTLPNQAANKAYVDAIASGITFQGACRLATTGALTATYNNGASGVGATLTNSGAFAALTLDGILTVVGNRILVKNQASTFQNGIYTVTVVGDGVSVNWVLTRATDYDQPSEINPGDFVLISSGTTLGGSGWIETATVTAVGTDPIVFAQFSASLPIAIADGGTGATTAAGARANLSAAVLGANNDITSMTGLTGSLKAPTGIQSSAGLNLLTFNYIASAVNYVTMVNAATGNPPLIDGFGSDPSVNLNLRAKNGDFWFSDSTGTKAPYIKLFNAAGDHAIGIRAPTTFVVDPDWIWPSTDGAGAFVSDGAGNLSFDTSINSAAWTSFAGTIGYTGFSGTPTTTTARYKIIGKTLFFQITMTGTSNATGFTITNMPATSAIGTNTSSPLYQAVNNSSSVYTVQFSMTASSTTLVMTLSNNPSGWTNSGTKAISFSGFYEIS